MRQCIRNHLQQLWEGISESELYPVVRKRFPQLHSYHILSAIRRARAKIQSVRVATTYRNYKAKLQKRALNDPVQLYNKTYRLTRKGNDFCVRISHTPHKQIEAKLLLTERPKCALEEALDGKKLGGALLARAKGNWILYITVKKTVLLPRWSKRKTIVAVDLGLRNLAYCVAYDTCAPTLPC